MFQITEVNLIGQKLS